MLGGVPDLWRVLLQWCLRQEGQRLHLGLDYVFDLKSGD